MIDHLLDTYARKLAENMNQGFAIDARVPSVMIAGPANFPVGKKGKQNRARNSNMEEWRHIQGLLDMLYNDVILSGRLHTVLADLNEQAVERLNLIIRQTMESEGVPEAIKAEKQMV